MKAFGTFSALVLVLLTGCGTALQQKTTQASVAGKTDSGDNIALLYETARCELISRGGFILIDNTVVLENLLLPLGARVAQETTGRVDFNTHRVLLVDNGASPSGGYASGLVSSAVEPQGDTGVVRIRLPQQAIPAKRQTQNLSHSCALYTIPADYRTIQVRSQFDDLLVEF
jgi:hypothetical protein